MYAESIPDTSATCSQLNQRLNDLKVKLDVSKNNRETLKYYADQMRIAQTNIENCSRIIETLKPLVEDINDYINTRRAESMQNVNDALRMAGQIIQDASEGIYMQLDGDEAWLSTPDGLEVQMVEGGGYRQISSAFLRSVILGCSPYSLQTLLLDEVFSLVSPENSATLSLYLNVMCQNVQVISIEQKPQVYSNVDGLVYRFNKGEKFATVSCEEITRGGEDNVQDSEALGAIHDEVLL